MAFFCLILLMCQVVRLLKPRGRWLYDWQMKFIDLSQTIEPGMQLYSRTAPQPVIEPLMSHADSAESGNYSGTTCEISKLSFISSIGTYIDSPYHFNPDGPSIEALDLSQVVLPGVVVDCTHMQSRQPIEADVLDGIDIAGKAVLFNTGWSQYWGDDRYFEYPFLSRSVSEVLLAGGAKLAGIDILVADDMTDPTRPAHTTLLNNNILIVENLTNLSTAPDGAFTFFAVPAKVAGATAFPVRAFAMFN